MADITWRANLKTTKIPMLSELQGQTVIVRNQDQGYVPYVADQESIATAMGIPQIYYAHNIVPTDYGYKSVGYSEHTSAAFPDATMFNQVVSIRDSVGNYALLSATALGNVYVMPTGASAWTAPNTPPDAATIAGKRMSVAFVAGTTYIYFEGVGCYSYNWNTNTISGVTLTGLTVTDIIGIVGNSGYLIAYSKDAVAWSSTTDPTDFVPSLTTGAGGGQVESARGNIVTVEPVYGGMIVFTERNAVACIYSSNVRYPYNFVEITGCGGLTDSQFVSYDANSGALHAYTTSGLQTVTLKKATSIFPEITDFISGGLLEDFNELTDELELISTAGSETKKRIAVVADRYVVISYGKEKLTHAIFIDSALKQVGKLKIEHTDCFEFQQYASAVVEVPKKSVAFLGAGGSIHILDTDINSPNSNGVMILGKYQYVRSRFLTMQAVEFENVNTGDNFSLQLLPSMDGKVWYDKIEGYAVPPVSGSKAREYKFHKTGKNHSLLFKGAFNAVSLVLTFTPHGAR